MARRPKGETRAAIRGVLRRQHDADLDTIYGAVERKLPGVVRHSVRSGLNQMVAAGEVERIARGRYRLR